MNLPEYDYKFAAVRKLKEMPFDKEFDGNLCHATGYEMLINGEWWNEYETPDGDYRYGR